MATHTIKFDGADIRTEAITTTQLTMNTVPISAKFSLQNVTNTGNTTTEVVQFTNSTTGLVTTSNVEVGGGLEVGGDLIVGGTSLVNAIYPVGTVIDRATAITDTHLNGKYKAFLAAPDQEWELVSDGQNKVLEDLFSPCDTTSLKGRATMVPVTVRQETTTTFEVVTGSLLTNFTPLAGTKTVVYEFELAMTYGPDARPLISFKLEYQINGGSWIEVVDARRGLDGVNNALRHRIVWPFELGVSSPDADRGEISNDRPALGFRLQAVEYSSTYEGTLHEYNDFGTSSDALFSAPTYRITSLGIDNLKYKRTA
jgi:hypothetical protein